MKIKTLLSLIFCVSSQAFGVFDPYTPSYEKIEPYYMEICGSSQYREANGKTGGPLGHAVLYIHGACRNELEALPRLQFCENRGVGLSVNPMFANARWVAVDGREFFFKGEISDNDVIDEAALAVARQKAIEKHLYRGITVNPTFGNVPGNMSSEEYLANNATGTDYAVSFARSFYCARIPLKKPMVLAVVNALNKMNEAVADGSYQWDMIKDNCAHVVYNAAASVNLWSEKQVNRSFPLEQYYYVAIPVNSVLTGVEVLNDRKLWDPVELYMDESFRDPVLNFQYIPVRPRAYLTQYPMHTYANVIYDTNPRFDVYDYPFMNINKSQLDNILNTPRYWSEAENRIYFRDIYLKLQDDSSTESLTRWLRTPGFQTFLDTLKIEVDTLLKTL